MIDPDHSRLSPNHGPRVNASGRPDCIVLHYTGMKDGPSAIDWLCDPASQVSCHYVVAENGRVSRLVADERRAWHAGRSFWAGETDLNSASLGIEIVNGGHDYGLPAYPNVQIAAVVALCRNLVDRHGIAPTRVLAHSDIAPSRKRDPGERFPWWSLAEAGLCDWIAPAPDREGTVLEAGMAGPDVVQLQLRLASIGYGLATTGTFDLETETVVRAFQRRHRPARVDGRADPGTMDTLTALLAAPGRTTDQA